jgi:hypothetical protein
MRFFAFQENYPRILSLPSGFQHVTIELIGRRFEERQQALVWTDSGTFANATGSNKVQPTKGLAKVE